MVFGVGLGLGIGVFVVIFLRVVCFLVSQVESVECELHLHSFFINIYPTRWVPRWNPLRNHRSFNQGARDNEGINGKDCEVYRLYNSAVSSKARGPTKESNQRQEPSLIVSFAWDYCPLQLIVRRVTVLFVGPRCFLHDEQMA